MFNPDEEVELIAKAPVSDMKETDSQKKRKGNISTLTCKGV